MHITLSGIKNTFKTIYGCLVGISDGSRLMADLLNNNSEFFVQETYKTLQVPTNEECIIQIFRVWRSGHTFPIIITEQKLSVWKLKFRTKFLFL